MKVYFAYSISGGGDMSHYEAVVAAEVTNPSLGAGYELAYAEQLGPTIKDSLTTAKIL